MRVSGRRAAPTCNVAGDKVYFRWCRSSLILGRAWSSVPVVSSESGRLARELGSSATLLVADAGLVAAGHVATVRRSLEAAAVAVIPYHEFGENPDSAMVEAGRACAGRMRVDCIVALGGGSSLDCAKGVNFLLTNGGAIARLPRLRQGDERRCCR